MAEDHTDWTFKVFSSEKQAGCDKQQFLFCLLFNNKRLHSTVHKRERAVKGNKPTSLFIHQKVWQYHNNLLSAILQVIWKLTQSSVSYWIFI